MSNTLTSFLALLVVGVILLPSAVLAGGEVEIIGTSTLRMALDDEVRQLNGSIMAWSDDGTPIQMWETDREIGLEIYAQNKNFHRITLIGERNTNKQYPVILCTFNEITQYERDLVNSSFCENYNYAYDLKTRRIGQSLNFRIPPITIINGQEHNGWSIWVGEGAGGGGGLPVCTGISVGVSHNETKTITGNNFTMGGAWTFQGLTEVGCSVNYFLYQGTLKSSSWATIYPTNDSAFIINCNGVNPCRQMNPVINTWYYKNIQCDENGNTTIRIMASGVVAGKGVTVYSTVRANECYTPYVEIINDDDDGLVWFLFIGLMILSTLVFTRKKREKWKKKTKA